MRKIKVPTVYITYDYRHRADRTKQGTVDVCVYYNRQRRYITTGVKVYPREWDTHTVSVRNRLDAEELNGRVAAVKKRIDGYINSCIAGGRAFSFDGLAAAVNRGERREMSFADWIKAELDADNSLCRYTKSSYYQLISYLKRFGRIRGFGDINATNAEDFVNWLRGLGQKQQTVHGHYKCLKKYVNLARKRGLIDGDPLVGVSVPPIPLKSEACVIGLIVADYQVSWPYPFVPVSVMRNKYRVRRHERYARGRVKHLRARLQLVLPLRLARTVRSLAELVKLLPLLRSDGHEGYAGCGYGHLDVPVVLPEHEARARALSRHAVYPLKVTHGILVPVRAKEIPKVARGGRHLLPHHQLAFPCAYNGYAAVLPRVYAYYVLHFHSFKNPNKFPASPCHISVCRAGTNSLSVFRLVDVADSLTVLSRDQTGTNLPGGIAYSLTITGRGHCSTQS